jgi:isoquinoline 1-oxidoreductase alpha subunit
MEMHINGQTVKIPEEWQGDTLLWVLREALGLVGTRFGCGMGQCGACTVLLDGEPVRSCMLPVSSAANGRVETVESLGESHPVVRAWEALQVPQCGYCQSGQMMATVALLRRTPRPDDAQLHAALDSHLCRCGTHQRIRQAAQRAARETGGAT